MKTKPFGFVFGLTVFVAMGLASVVPVAGQEPRTLAMDEEGIGVFEGQDGEVGMWSFTGEAGDVIGVAADAVDLQPVLVLRSPAGALLAADLDNLINVDILSEQENISRIRDVLDALSISNLSDIEEVLTLSADNLRGGDRSARLAAILPADGRYEVRVSTSRGGSGEYTVVVDSVDVVSVDVDADGHGEHTSVLTEDDPEVQILQFNGGAGQEVTVTAESDVFDTVIQLRSTRGERLAEDDDGGTGSNSRLVARLPSADDYQIWVSAYDRETGRYRVEIDVSDSLELDGGVWDFLGVEGQVVGVTASSDAFDTALQLLTPDGGEHARDDDGGPGSDSRLVTRLPANGLYQVRVSSTDNRMGRYELGVHVVDVEAVELDASGYAEYSGTLDREGAGVAAIEFYRNAGDVISVRAESGDFDAVVEVRTAAGDRLARNDDDGSGTDARVLASIPSTGMYQAWVSAVGEGGGEYTVRVRSMELPSARELGVEPEVGFLGDGGSESRKVVV